MFGECFFPSPIIGKPCLGFLQLSALTGAIGVFDGPLSFSVSSDTSDTSDFRSSMTCWPCLAIPSTHATTFVWLPALTVTVGVFDGPLSFSVSSDPWFPRISVLRRACHASPCLAMPSTPCHTTTSIWLPALTGTVGVYDGPLSFSVSSDPWFPRISVLRRARHAFHATTSVWLPALTGTVGVFDGPWSFSVFSDSSNSSDFLPLCRAMPCHASPCSGRRFDSPLSFFRFFGFFGIPSSP